MKKENMKRFSSLKEFLKSKEFKKKNLSWCDLSNLDLSDLPIDTWDNFIFIHTNFANTNINFSPYTLKLFKNSGFEYCDIQYCDFTNCDLSDVTSLYRVKITGANFTNTGLHVDPLDGCLDDLFDFLDVTFGDCFCGNELESFGSLMDVDTLLNNPNLSFSSYTIFDMIFKTCFLEYEVYKQFTLIECLDKINQALEIDRKGEGKLWRMWKSIAPYLSSENKINFFLRQKISDLTFGRIDFSEYKYEFLSKFEFDNCRFERIILPYRSEKMNRLWNTFYASKIKEVYFPNLTPSSWREIDNRDNGKNVSRIFGNVTVNRSLYVELGRLCNGNCKFCRNQYLESCKYDYERIKKNLEKIYPYLNRIVIGGGEPSLLKHDLYDLCINMNNKISVFTNASSEFSYLDNLAQMVALNISRHSISDKENNEIFGVETLKNYDLENLNSHSEKKITLFATCFQGGLDSAEKILKYIYFYHEELHINNFVFQTLHLDLNASFNDDTVLPISDFIIDTVIETLREEGYRVNIPIYSTGDYKLITVRYRDLHISFKKYISKEELEKYWYFSPKRGFDLSMDPSGNVYENWHQASGEVLLKKLK